jgi:cellulose synthase/poly-beta-1,6-N-acetylglucosamine synthase-like glycosyltransferase
MKRTVLLTITKYYHQIFPFYFRYCPANESLNIIENVRSLLSCHYANYDVIIVNDGSKDDSLEKLIEAYNLVKVDSSLMNK